MHNRVNYTIVGLFVVTLGIALLGAGLWLAGDVTRDDGNRYLVMPTEPMTGLGTNSTVKYQGIDVGRVRELGIDDQGDVRILISVDRDVPVRADTRVRLGSQGLTGLGHLELLPGTADAGPARADEYAYPVLRNAPSLRTRLETAVEDGLASIDRVGRQLEVLLSDDNLQTLQATMDHVEIISGTLAANSEQITATLAETEALLRETRTVLSGAPETMARIDRTLETFEETARRFGDTAERLGETGERGELALQRLDRETLPQINQLLLDVQGLTGTYERLGTELTEHPNRLIFGAPRRPPGPGESD
ncbi:MlaD family protein [Aquisalimonas sp.]|uniref:MlaD family protein n=1 Tax=Aquisalimonas sp. TaxID=1872621 RepID=UPI0025C04245|nr:MlaD family protein [Aquisalimonas sp.]